MSDNTIPNEITPNDTIDNLFVTGNVGIGIEEPGPATARLELKSQESQIGTIKLFPNSGAGRDFSYDGGTDNVFLFSHYGQDKEGRTEFIWDNGASSTPLLTIKNTGNIGIGRTNPQSMLHIGDGLGGGYRPWMVRGTQVSWDSDNVFFGLKDEGPNRKDAVIAWGDNPNSDVFRFIFTANGGPDNGQEIMRLQPNGNVGIGTPNPEGKLHLFDSTRGNMKLFATSGVGHDFGYDGGIDNFFAFAHYGLESGQTKFVWHQNEAATRDLLTIKNTGNIGIGTADLSLSLNQTQLHVEGKLIYSGGSLGGLSFGNRDTSGFVENPTKGERWTWYSSGGTARLWSSQDRLSINGNGNVGIGTTDRDPLQYARLTIKDAAVPLAFRESDRAVTEGGLWRMPLDAGTLRFDVNTSASGNFSPYISTLSLYPNGDIRVARDVYANRNVYANGNVGIGTTNPLQYGRLTIEDAAVPLAFRESDRAVTEGGLWRMPLDAGILRFDVNTSASGNFSPSIPVLSMYPNGDVRVTGDVYARNQILSSSRELKENIAELSGKEAVEALKNLNPVKFNFKADSDKNLHIGFIAEDVPELVATSDRKTLSPMDIVAVLTQALKEQQNTISALAEKVKLLEAKTA